MDPRRPVVFRIAFAAAFGLSAISVAAQVTLPPVEVVSRRELSADEQIAHVLSRLTFGARPQDAKNVARLGVDAWIERQLQPDRIRDGDAQFALQEIPETAPMRMVSFPSMTPGLDGPMPLHDRVMGSATRQPERMTTMRGTPSPAVRDVFRTSPAVARKIVRAQMTERQLLEVITDFWENHFSVYSAKMPTQQAFLQWERDVIRPHALGRFRDLLESVARSPAMMFYLDNYLSRADSINENYARELLELHTMGADGGYTQDDVIDVARAFTGWTMTPRVNTAAQEGSVAFSFNKSMHDRTAKSVLGHTLAAGRGVEDGEDVLDILARHPSTARFIALKLARRLVSDSPPASLVERAAETFTRTDGDISAVIRSIVHSDEFFSRAAFRSKVRTPFEFLVATLRAFDIPTDARGFSARTLVEFGQPVFGRVTPDGWPDYSDAWVNAGALLKRVLFSADLLDGKFDLMRPNRWDGWNLYTNKPAEIQADGVIRLLLGGTASAETRAALLEARGGGFDRLQQMAVVALGSPEFQRR